MSLLPLCQSLREALEQTDQSALPIGVLSQVYALLQAVESSEGTPKGGDAFQKIDGPALAGALKQHDEALVAIWENIGGTEEEVLDSLVKSQATFAILCETLGVPTEEEEEGEDPLAC